MAKRKPLAQDGLVKFIFDIVQRLKPRGRFLVMTANGTWRELSAME